MKEVIDVKYYIISFYNLHIEFNTKFHIVVPANAKNKNRK